MILNEEKVKNILKEEYDKRLAGFLLERLQLMTSDDINVWENADQLKVRHEDSGIEFTFVKFEGDNAILNMPEESRLHFESEGSNLLPEMEFLDYEDDLDYIEDIEDYDDYSEEESDILSSDLDNESKPKSKPKSKDQVSIPREAFEREFIL